MKNPCKGQRKGHPDEARLPHSFLLQKYPHHRDYLPRCMLQRLLIELSCKPFFFHASRFGAPNLLTSSDLVKSTPATNANLQLAIPSPYRYLLLSNLQTYCSYYKNFNFFKFFAKNTCLAGYQWNSFSTIHMKLIKLHLGASLAPNNVQ